MIRKWHTAQHILHSILLHNFIVQEETHKTTELRDFRRECLLKCGYLVKENMVYTSVYNRTITLHFTLWFYIDDSKRSEDQQYHGTCSCSHGSLLKFDKQVIHNWNTVRESLSCCYCSQSLTNLSIVCNASFSCFFWQTGQMHVLVKRNCCHYKPE